MTGIENKKETKRIKNLKLASFTKEGEVTVSADEVVTTTNEGEEVLEPRTIHINVYEFEIETDSNKDTAQIAGLLENKNTSKKKSAK
jgi:hypothetical protein